MFDTAVRVQPALILSECEEHPQIELSYEDAIKLARAVFACALSDASSPNSGRQGNAQMWLCSKHAEIFADAAGFDPEFIKRWVKAGCPKAERSKA